jgi:hypothetical protein
MELSLETEGASSWRHREPNSGDIGSLIMDRRHRKPHPGYRRSLILETYGASWRQRERHPGNRGSLLLETK